MAVVRTEKAGLNENAGRDAVHVEQCQVFFDQGVPVRHVARSGNSRQRPCKDMCMTVDRTLRRQMLSLFHGLTRFDLLALAVL